VATTSKVPAGVIAPVKQKCAEIVASFPGITHVYGYHTVPDHNNRRCIDFMVPGKSVGDLVAAYIKEHAGRLGVNGQVWQRRVMGFPHSGDGGAYRGPTGQWRTYSGANPHTDHVHVEFDGAVYVAPSTPKIPLAGTVWVDRLKPGVTDSDSVRLVQRALGIPETGTYDAATVAAVRARQRGWGDAPQFCDGLLGIKQLGLLMTEAGMRVDIRTDPSGPVTPPKIEEPPVVKPPARPAVTIVSANVLRRTDPDRQRKRFTDRLPDLITHIRSGSPTVVLLQEVDSVTAAAVFGGLGQSWHYDRCHGLAIGWYTPELERVGDAQCHLYPDRENRFRHSVQLRHRATGETFWADNTHLENDGDPATDGHRARHVEISAFVAGTKTGKRVFGGDLNSTTPSGASATTRQRQKPRPQLRAAGWWLLTDHPDVTNRALESHHGGKTRNGDRGPWIDDAGGKGVTYVPGSGRLIRTDQTDASDHHMLRFAVRL
jgi:hypothetical protein